jgi:signal transduction histidine kinase
MRMSNAETPLPPVAEADDAKTRPPLKRRHSFSRRLALAFAAVAALTAALAGLLLSAAWNYQFTQYLHANLQNTADGIAEISAQVYPQLGGWTIETLSQIPRFGPATGVGVQILDPSGKIVYDDASVSAHVADVSGLAPGQGQAPKTDVILEPKGPVVTSKVMVASKQVGTVRVWTYSAGALMTVRDQKFKRGSLMGLTVAALVAIAFASMGGVWYANRLVRPIERITVTAQALKAGDRDARTQLQGDDEIGFLGRTFDEMADAVEADREMERRLTADVAHELRTPLQAIQATVEAMQDGVLPADEERLGIVRDETMRLARLADGILELTRLERGSVPFTCSRIDLASPVRAAVDTHEALIETREIVLSVDIAEGTYACVDSDRLQQAVGNLLSNAARYTPAGGRIDVSVGHEAGQAVIEVADTGMGIADENLNRVFSRFWRADEARATTSGGLGIGLAVTKEIVERHKGTIGVSRRSGGGSVFAIRLPLA